MLNILGTRFGGKLITTVELSLKKSLTKVLLCISPNLKTYGVISWLFRTSSLIFDVVEPLILYPLLIRNLASGKPSHPHPSILICLSSNL